MNIPWNKISKTFRGLIAEKKDGEWELSKGNVSYWIVLGFMLKIWNTRPNIEIPVENYVEVQNLVSQLSQVSDVPEYMFYAFVMLLSYAGVKLGVGAMGNAASLFQSFRKPQ